VHSGLGGSDKKKHILLKGDLSLPRQSMYQPSFTKAKGKQKEKLLY